MHLSDTDKKMVVRLQRQQHTFIRWRWGILISSVMCLACGIYGFWVSRQAIRPDAGDAAALAITLPVAFLMFGIGAWLMIYTFTNWNGKPEFRLLLTLIEDSRDDV
jgi:hypothetical protein